MLRLFFFLNTKQLFVATEHVSGLVFIFKTLRGDKIGFHIYATFHYVFNVYIMLFVPSWYETS